MAADNLNPLDTALNKLLYPFHSGKKSKFAYFVSCALRELVPGFVCRKQLPDIIKQGFETFDRVYVEDRVNYYNKLATPTPLAADAPRLADHRMRSKGQVYYFDTREFTRFFPQNRRWHHLPGDITVVPPEPTIVKSRPVAGNNANAVLLNLNKVRHFLFVEDKVAFSQKKDLAVFRGKVRNKPKRITLFRHYFNNPLCDLGDTSGKSPDPDAWKTGKLTLEQQLRYKFILAIEGNDVASNLKWVMSSNSIAMMPEPEYETWFMEGRLIPNVHYIQIAPDYSDLEAKIRYYGEHLDEAQRIIDQAHAYVAQFQNPEREKLISLLVMAKYFALTDD